MRTLSIHTHTSHIPSTEIIRSIDRARRRPARRYYSHYIPPVVQSSHGGLFSALYVRKCVNKMLRRREQLAGSYRARVIICASTVIRARARARTRRESVCYRPVDLIGVYSVRGNTTFDGNVRRLVCRCKITRVLRGCLRVIFNLGNFETMGVTRWLTRLAWIYSCDRDLIKGLSSMFLWYKFGLRDWLFDNLCRWNIVWRILTRLIVRQDILQLSQIRGTRERNRTGKKFVVII